MLDLGNNALAQSGLPHHSRPMSACRIVSGEETGKSRGALTSAAKSSFLLYARPSIAQDISFLTSCFCTPISDFTAYRGSIDLSSPSCLSLAKTEPTCPNPQLHSSLQVTLGERMRFHYEAELIQTWASSMHSRYLLSRLHTFRN